MEDDSVGVDRAGRLDRGAHRLDALGVDGLVGSGEVHEVQRVDEDG